MSIEKTFTIIKPIAVQHKHSGAILARIEDAGFRISALKTIRLSKADAEDFYNEHKGKSFYEELIDFMSSDYVIVAILEKENAIKDFRELIGATDPIEAMEGTIRKIFAESKTHNAIHGSDSVASAERESNFFFSIKDRY